MLLASTCAVFMLLAAPALAATAHEGKVVSAGDGKLATMRKDGRPSVVPVWFDLEGETLVFTTWHKSIKAASIRRDPRVCLCVDDETPPFAYVQVEGTAVLSHDAEQLQYWATRIGGRYMGYAVAETYGKRNSVEGELLVRVTPTHMHGYKEVAGW